MLPALPGKVEQTGIILPANLSFDEWTEIGSKLRGAREAVRWWIGDWLAFGEAAYGERYAQALDNAEFDYQTLRNFVWVARAIPHDQRRASLSWSHHAEAASLETEARNEVLQRAEVEQLSAKDVRAIVAETRPSKPRKPHGLHIGKYLLWDEGGSLYLSDKTGEVCPVNEEKLESALDAFWNTL